MTMWDYRMRKMDIAWELASRIIPEKPQPSGAWTEADYIAKAQKVMKEAAEAVDAVFTDRGGVKYPRLVWGTNVEEAEDRQARPQRPAGRCRHL